MPPGNAWSRWTEPFSDSEPPESSVHTQTSPGRIQFPPTRPISHHFTFQRTTRLSSPWGVGGADALPSPHLHGLLALLPMLHVAKKQRNNAWWSKTPYIIAGMDEAEGRKKGRKKKNKVPEEWASNRFAAENRAGSIIAKQADLLRAPNPTSSLPEP